MTSQCWCQGTVYLTVAHQSNMGLEGSTTDWEQTVHLNIWGGDISKRTHVTFPLCSCISAWLMESLVPCWMWAYQAGQSCANISHVSQLIVKFF